MNKSSTRFFANSFGLRILPSIILCLSLGFLGSLFFKNAYQEIKLIDEGDVSFQAAKLVIGFIFVVGFLLKRLLSGMRALYLEFSVLFLLVLEMISLNGYSSGLLQVDYIFYTDIFLFFAGLNSFVTGMLAARLKNFRLWGFLAGGASYIIYSFLNPSVVIKSENYLMPLVFVMALELILFPLSLSRITLARNRFKKLIRLIISFSILPLLSLSAILFCIM